MIKTLLPIFLFSLILSSFVLLPKDAWWILETTSERSAYDETGAFYWEIQFSEKVQVLDGQKIRLKGYFYTYSDTSIVLFTKNKQPFHGCSADPKVSMIEMMDSLNFSFNLQQHYVIEGILELNRDFHKSTSYTFPYKLRGAVIVQ